MSVKSNMKDNCNELKPIGAYVFGNGLPENVQNQPFLIEADTGASITFKELLNKSHRLARSMLDVLNVKPNDFIAHYGDSSIQYGICMSACLLLGSTYVNIAPANGLYELEKQLKHLKIKYLFASKHSLLGVRQLVDKTEILQKLTIVVFDTEREHELNQVFVDWIQNQPLNLYTLEQLILEQSGSIERIPYFSTDLSSIALITQTSGTSGTPKGVCHTNRSVLNNAIDYVEFGVFGKYCHLPMLLSFPFGHVSGYILFITGLVHHMTLVILNKNCVESLFQLIERYQIGQLFGAINVINELALYDPNKHDISTLKMALSAGSKVSEKISKKLVEECGIHMMESYGSSELLYVSCTSGIGVPKTSGKILSGYEVKIIDLKTEQTIDSKQTGEICFRGKYSFKEYYQNPVETAKSVDSEGWFHTGDVGFIDDNHELNITDRIKELIKFRGFSVYPVALESFLSTHDAVKCSVVVGVKHKLYENVCRAYVLLKPDSTNVTADDLIQYANENIGFRNRFYGGVVIVDDIKYKAIGKVDRQYYKALCADEVLEHEFPVEY